MEPLKIQTIETARLSLREWREADREPFARRNADPVVMEFFSHPLSRAESDGMIDRIMANMRRRGWGLWAVERKDETRFAGFIGLSEPRFHAHFTPCVEVGWRLSIDAWGRGFATEGARAVLDYALGSLGLKEVVSFTTERNLRSRRVMEKLGMERDLAGNFPHPSLPCDHPLSPHVLYRITNRCSESIENRKEHLPRR